MNNLGYTGYRRKGKRTYKKRKVRKYGLTRFGRINRQMITDQTLKLKCEDEVYIYAPNTATTVLFQGGNNYYNMRTLLATSQTYQGNYQLFSRAKITGLKISCSWIKDPTTEVITNSNICSVPIYVGFYPQFVGQNQGLQPNGLDTSLMIKPNLTIPQEKYWSFPDNYFDSNGYGYGVWMDPVNASGNLTGQLSTSNYNYGAFNASYAMISIKITLYVVFNQRNS